MQIIPKQTPRYLHKTIVVVELTQLVGLGESLAGGGSHLGHGVVGGVVP